MLEHLEYDKKDIAQTEKISLALIDLFKEISHAYFNKIVPYQKYLNSVDIGYFGYSFSLNPEEYQPSGAVNLSSYKYKSFVYQFNQKFIDCVTTNSDAFMIKTYALGYNILSFKNGMASLVFNI